MLQHIIETQQFIVGEVCRTGTNLRRQSIPDHIKEYARNVPATADKEGLSALMRSSMDKAEATLRDNEYKLIESMKRFDGPETHQD